MAQTEVVDVRRQPQPGRATRDVTEVRHHVEHRSRRGDRGMVLAGERRARHLHRENEMLGEPDGFEAELLCHERSLYEHARVHPTEADTELHGSEDTRHPSEQDPVESATCGRSAAWSN